MSRLRAREEEEEEEEEEDERRGGAPFSISSSHPFFFPDPDLLIQKKKTVQASPGPARASRVVRFGGEPGPAGVQDASRRRNSTGSDGGVAVVTSAGSGSLVALFRRGTLPCSSPLASSALFPLASLLLFSFSSSSPPTVAPRRRRSHRPRRLALRVRLQAPRVREAGREGEPAAGRLGAAAEVGESRSGGSGGGVFSFFLGFPVLFFDWSCCGDGVGSRCRRGPSGGESSGGRGDSRRRRRCRSCRASRSSSSSSSSFSGSSSSSSSDSKRGRKRVGPHPRRRRRAQARCAARLRRAPVGHGQPPLPVVAAAARPRRARGAGPEARRGDGQLCQGVSGQQGRLGRRRRRRRRSRE